ncbi:hypothetical protein AVEN_265517-1 [Araneus ventricosus]|uniref:Uncharacterized protein n=1 Tax=Araneus ventricosus TaxID=182803 RepID=A0A4Y2LEN2_ARAVE|nr:hypothetical protein AVEN_265517-1 [Araneus ventricosus]
MQRSRPLYKLLHKGRWRKSITTDKAWFYLSGTNVKSKVQYLSRDQNRPDLTPSTTVPHPKGVIVWMRIAANALPNHAVSGVTFESPYKSFLASRPYYLHQKPPFSPPHPQKLHLFLRRRSLIGLLTYPILHSSSPTPFHREQMRLRFTASRNPSASLLRPPTDDVTRPESDLNEEGKTSAFLRDASRYADFTVEFCRLKKSNKYFHVL